MKRVSFACVVVGMAAAAEAVAAPCYLPAEAEADQAIRLRADLMVIGETCKDPSYARFLERNRDTLTAYEQILTEHFGRDGSKSPDASMQAYVAGLENEARLRAAASPSFCADAFELVATTQGMRPDELRSYAVSQAEARQQDYAVCANPEPGATATTAAVPETPASSADDDGLVAALSGGDLARMLDPVDRQRLKETTQHTLESSVSGQVMGWRNPFSRSTGTVVATRAFRNAAGQWCRGFEQSITVSHETRRGTGTACRRADGWWDIQP